MIMYYKVDNLTNRVIKFLHKYKYLLQDDLVLGLDISITLFWVFTTKI